jgi:hypothetical protein
MKECRGPRTLDNRAQRQFLKEYFKTDSKIYRRKSTPYGKGENSMQWIYVFLAMT